MERWRLLEVEHRDPRMNLAIEEAVARFVGINISPPTIRFWRNINAVVIGRFQRADYEVNFDECKRYKVSVVRRFTGGGAVYQDDGNLNCAVSLPCSHRLIKRTIPTIYEILGKSLINGLYSLGLRAHMNSNAVYIDGKKISGMAGAINWGTAFHHCTFLVNTNIDIMSKVLKPATIEASKKYVQSKREVVTTIDIQLGRDVSVLDVQQKLINALETVSGMELFKGGLADKEKLLAQELHRDKYSNSEHAILLEVNT